jgi:hypothetical protein
MVVAAIENPWMCRLETAADSGRRLLISPPGSWEVSDAGSFQIKDRLITV